MALGVKERRLLKENEGRETGALTSPSAYRPGPRASAGWEGWDQYARFYDWENARTLGTRDVTFWQRLAREVRGPILELGSGTGRVTLAVGRVARGRLVGIDRSAAMLAYARRRLRRSSVARTVALVRGDIRALPFPPARGSSDGFRFVMAPYGILQSLTGESDLRAALREVAAVLAPHGLFGVDLVPDLPNWVEYRNKVRLRGRLGRSHLTLVESVRQDRRGALTLFDQVFIVRRGAVRERHRFSLTFRTLSITQMRRRLEAAGLHVEAIMGDYEGGPWTPAAETWLLLARKGT